MIKKMKNAHFVEMRNVRAMATKEAQDFLKQKSETLTRQLTNELHGVVEDFMKF